eukprot:323964-Chlamydomonas_euryale.AAC.1
MTSFTFSEADSLWHQGPHAGSSVGCFAEGKTERQSEILDIQCSDAEAHSRRCRPWRTRGVRVTLPRS